MAKYPKILQTAVTNELAELVERIAATEMRSISDVVRILITRGVATLAPPQQHVNGASHHQEASHVRGQ